MDTAYLFCPNYVWVANRVVFSFDRLCDRLCIWLDTLVNMIIFILLLFLITIFGTLLYFKNKKHNQSLLDSGICPNCGSEVKRFRDEKSGIDFEVSPIESRILKNHGCSGIVEIEYQCKSCGHKEIHSTQKGGCSF